MDKGGQGEYVPNNEFSTLSVKLQPILTELRFFGHYWTIQISVQG